MLADRIGQQGRDDMAIPTQFRGSVVEHTRPPSNLQVAGRTGRGRPRRGSRCPGGRDLRLPRAERGGKTTTLRMLATLLTPTAGTATVAGADLIREPQLVRAGSATSPRADPPTPPRPAGASSSSRVASTGWTSPTAKARAAEVLAALDLESAADRPTGTYSGRHEAPARHRARHRPPPGGPVPR